MISRPLQHGDPIRLRRLCLRRRKQEADLLLRGTASMAIDETTVAEGEEEDTKGGETILPGSEQTAAATSTIIAEKA